MKRTPEKTTAATKAKPAAAAEKGASENSNAQPKAATAAKAKAQRDAETNLPRRIWRGMPAWMFSAIVHAAVMIVLALLMIRGVAQEQSVLTSSMTEPFEPDVAELTADPAVLEKVEMDAAKLPDPGAVRIGSLAMVPNQQINNPGIGDLRVDPSGDLGQLFGTNGRGMADAGLGIGGASFFGVRAKGRKFVFVVDNSLSMGRGKFETAVHELMQSVSDLSGSQQFYVIFFSDTAYPLFYPKPARTMMSANEANVRRLEYWLPRVELCLQTKGEEAMKLAFALKPDVIFILSDGSFTDKTTEKLLAIPSNSSRIKIHTLGFRMKPQAEQDMRRIAKHFGGVFTEVQVTPEMVALDKKLNRPRNRTPNGPWGIKLGNKKKKKN